MKAINSFVTNGLQNTFFYFPQKKVIQVWNDDIIKNFLGELSLWRLIFALFKNETIL